MYKINKQTEDYFLGSWWWLSGQRACLNSYNPSSNPAEADRVLVSDASWIAIQKYDGHHWKLFCMYKIYRVWQSLLTKSVQGWRRPLLKSVSNVFWSWKDIFWTKMQRFASLTLKIKRFWVLRNVEKSNARFCILL